MEIAHISDTHISPYGGFMEEKYDRLVEKIHEIDPDLVVHTGDVTDNGFLDDYKLAREKLEQIENEMVTVPGNHDVRNLGQDIYPRFLGKKYTIKEFTGLAFIALDTTVPDIETGRLGRTGQRHLSKSLERFKDLFKVVSIHHHLVPVPMAGRERNVIDDAGDVLKMLCDKNAHLVLMGHKHVPNVTRVENTIMANAGTFSSVRTRGYHGHSFNLISISDRKVEIQNIKLLEGRFEKHPLASYRLR